MALIGIDRYLRIKHFGHFKTFWTTRVVFLALIQAVLVLTAAILGKEHIGTPIYITIDVVVIDLITLLQVQTIRKTNTLHNESTVVENY